METTLEVRWFVKGTPPSVVQRWFRLECPGELLPKEPEIREDLYAYQKLEDVRKFQKLEPYLRDREAVNLKLREGNLELKLRQQKLGTQQFGNVPNSVIWEGNIEQWCKLTQQELKEHHLFESSSILQNCWICVYKEREQRLEQGVESELTWLRINNECWWSVAFEMTKTNKSRKKDKYFQEVVNRACQTYYGPKLSANNSYSYSCWLLKFQPPNIS